MWVKFELGNNKGTPIARLASGKICFPPRNANVIVDEWYEVEIEDEQERFCRLRILQRWSEVQSITGIIPRCCAATRVEDEQGHELHPSAYRIDGKLYPDEIWQFQVDHDRHCLIPKKWINGSVFQHTEAIRLRLQSLRQPDDRFFFQSNRYFPEKILVLHDCRIDERHVGEQIIAADLTIEDCEQYYLAHRDGWNYKAKHPTQSKDTYISSINDNFPYDYHGHGE